MHDRRWQKPKVKNYKRMEQGVKKTKETSFTAHGLTAGQFERKGSGERSLHNYATDLSNEGTAKGRNRTTQEVGIKGSGRARKSKRESLVRRAKLN